MNEGGNIIITVFGTSYKEAESIRITATKGNLTFTSPDEVRFHGKDGGIKFGDYKEEKEEEEKEKKKEGLKHITHPKILEVQFLDEKDKVIQQKNLTAFGNIKASDVLYGQKVKIKITTIDAIDGTKIPFKLFAVTKSANQNFPNAEKLDWTLEVKENKCETNLFFLNPFWYSEDFESYDYVIHQTKILSENLNEFHIEGQFDGIKFLLPEIKNRLKPVATYLRNYEELIGLFHTDNSGKKDLIENYDYKFTSLNEEIEDIVADFSTFLHTPQNLTIDQIKKRVEQDAKCLWDAAIKQVQAGKLDDRPLYWARNKMQVRLKRHPLFEKDIDFEKSIVKKGTELEKIIQLFEEKSRNYNGIDFSKTPVGKKKLLISGYDPFVMNPEKSGNPQQSNPSGVTALALHGKTIGNYYIQTFVFPVRYKDFDEFKNGKGVVETFFEPHIQNVDMIITVSQGGDFRFDVDRFPCKHRGGYMDNMFWGIKADGYNEQNFIQLSAGKEFYETTLPYQKIVPNKNNPSDTFWTYFNQTFEAFGDKYNKENVEGVTLNKKLSDIQTLTSILGSGSNYLSNEIFYRVAKMRTEQRPTLATGHLHIPRIQQKIVNTFPRGNVSTEDMNPKITELTAQIKTIIIKI